MTAVLATGLLAAAQAGQASTGEKVTFWIVASVIFLAALGMVLARNAVHSALLLALVMLGFAVFYAVQDAPFLAFVQIIVYTGAIMMLFLFVLMLVGVDRSDSLVETIRGHRIAALLVGVAFVTALLTGLAGAVSTFPSKGLTAANRDGNMIGVAQIIFNKYVYPFEVTSALLITAALGAMVLAHKERLAPRMSQRELSRQRFAGNRPSPLPGPGVFARHDSVDVPALLPDGSVAPGSVSSVILDQGGGSAMAALPGGERGGLGDDGEGEAR
jgi:NADH-quinone oxidoreductase subunit J